MNVERLLRMIAGLVVLLSLALAKSGSENWYWLTAFVAVNLVQSAFTNWCPMMTILKKLGVPSA